MSISVSMEKRWKKERFILIKTIYSKIVYRFKLNYITQALYMKFNFKNK